MYTQQELDSIDKKYFAVIVVDQYDVTLMSKNTHHVWQLHNLELPDGEVTLIFHKHKASRPYHKQGRANTLRQAIRSIRGHDWWQMNRKNRQYRKRRQKLDATAHLW